MAGEHDCLSMERGRVAEDGLTEGETSFWCDVCVNGRRWWRGPQWQAGCRDRESLGIRYVAFRGDNIFVVWCVWGGLRIENHRDYDEWMLFALFARVDVCSVCIICPNPDRSALAPKDSGHTTAVR